MQSLKNSNQEIFSVIIALVMVASLETLSRASLANPTEAEIDPAKVVSVLRAAKVVEPNVELNAAISEKQATVFTEQTATATDKDCKINAVLIAKEVINAFPARITRVRVLFSTPGTSKSSRVDVTAGDVKAYGLGAVDSENLLSSLEVIPNDSSSESLTAKSSLSVAPGPLLDKRLMLMSRIESLKMKGTSIKPFQAIFENIENEVNGDPVKLEQDVGFLSDKLTDQEKLLNQITKTELSNTANPNVSRPNASRPSLFNLSGASTGDRHPGMTRAMTKFQEVSSRLKQLQAGGSDVKQYSAQMAQLKTILDNPEELRKQLHQVVNTLTQIDQSLPASASRPATGSSTQSANPSTTPPGGPLMRKWRTNNRWNTN